MMLEMWLIQRKKADEGTSGGAGEAGGEGTSGGAGEATREGTSRGAAEAGVVDDTGYWWGVGVKRCDGLYIGNKVLGTMQGEGVSAQKRIFQRCRSRGACKRNTNSFTAQEDFPTSPPQQSLQKGEIAIENNTAGIMENRPNKNKRKDEGKNSSSQLTEYKKKRFFYVYGNYHSYYNYRIDQALDEDPRMKVLRKEWFEGKNCLDIGCNEGFITISIAQKFACKSIVGIDIDDRLIGKARSHLKTIAGVKEAIERNKQSAEEKCKVNADEGEDINLREQSYEGDDRINELESLDRREQSYEDDHRENRFQVIGSMKQFSKVEESTNNSEIICKKSVRDRISVLSRDCVSDNVEGRVGDQCLLERVCFRTENFIQESYSEFDAMYDTVLCLSVTKWVHLNWGDTGLIDLFAKIWQVLRPGLEQKMAADVFGVLMQASSKVLPYGTTILESFNDLVTEMRTQHYDAKTFAIKLKAMELDELLVDNIFEKSHYRRGFLPRWEACIWGETGLRSFTKILLGKNYGRNEGDRDEEEDRIVTG
ncbi:hypothetical protein SUGI_1131760 [Cryptomeria japonica]|nr:hypothetical protein SUGI_1131760 [Cryptomeria japonica]